MNIPEIILKKALGPRRWKRLSEELERPDAYLSWTLDEIRRTDYRASDILRTLFVWHRSIYGRKYWLKVFRELRNRELEAPS